MDIQFDKQYPVYALDTACFYTPDEAEIETKMTALRARLGEDRPKQEIGKRRKAVKNPLTKEERSALNRELGNLKDQLKKTIAKNVDVVRTVRPEKLTDVNVVQTFESSLVRELHMSSEHVNDEMVIVCVYFFGVAESIIKNGFNMRGNHYVFFSASAGQIRTKKFVAIREDLLEACMPTLTCGLSIADINAQGGVNVNKYLAYLALSNSSTEVWKDFDIDRCIVVDDFETVVSSEVDFIDEKDYSITREVHDVPITHTDGCGMILPQVSDKNFMVRAPWVKGLLSPFPFDRFIREADERDPSRNHAIIKDIYGQEHDVLREHIEVIFTSSQFKMHKYYSSWQDYKDKFKKYHCTAGKCNIEPVRIGKTTINYQMLQTLTSMTDEELDEICERTRSTLSRICTDKKTMLDCLGVRQRMGAPQTYFQKCLALYPELLRDEYCKEQLRDIRGSILNDARAGKLMIDGKYQFLIPDLYAACQYWFEGIAVPAGLLANGEVWTKQYARTEKLDVLRSPHLYKEHAVRRNVCKARPEIRKWFNTNGIYTSAFDCISKILQFDNDGDKALVVAEPTLVKVAERECKNVAPLYYPMAKAAPQELKPEAFYNGMVAAWTGGNIGTISNKITKIWNSPAPDVDAVKILCFLNNFVIDYAKTLYLPRTPKEWQERLAKLDRDKLPAFFKYAKGKSDSQITERGSGAVDRIFRQMPMYKFRFNLSEVGAFDYHLLMYNEVQQIGEKERELVDFFKYESLHIGANTCTKFWEEDFHWAYKFKALRKKMEAFGTRQYVVDVLVKALYDEKPTKRKAALWYCYGDVMYENLADALEYYDGICLKCGKRFSKKHTNRKYCPDCEPDGEGIALREAQCVQCGCTFKTRHTLDSAVCAACRMDIGEVTIRPQRRTAKKPSYKPRQIEEAREKPQEMFCLDCGVPIPVVKRGRPSVRCASCQQKRNREMTKRWKMQRGILKYKPVV